MMDGGGFVHQHLHQNNDQMKERKVSLARQSIFLTIMAHLAFIGEHV
jgi:hypothetical protein